MHKFVQSIVKHRYEIGLLSTGFPGLFSQQIHTHPPGLYVFQIVNAHGWEKERDLMPHAIPKISLQFIYMQ